VQLQLKERMVKITAVSPNRELHGESPKPVCYIGVTFPMQGDELAMFHPALRSMVFDRNKDGDLAEQGESGGTAIRFQHLHLPLKWKDECVGAEVTVHYGARDDSAIKLPGSVLGNFKLTPMEGGTTVVTCTITCHPDERGLGKLGLMVGTEIQITVIPPAEGAVDGGDS
jgi:hypothetical protein